MREFIKGKLFYPGTIDGPSWFPTDIAINSDTISVILETETNAGELLISGTPKTYLEIYTTIDGKYMIYGSLSDVETKSAKFQKFTTVHDIDNISRNILINLDNVIHAIRLEDNETEIETVDGRCYEIYSNLMAFTSLVVGSSDETNNTV